MSQKIETKKYFTLTNSNNNQITSRTDLDLIHRPDETVWIMNHIFLNPDEHDPHELSLLMSGYQVYPRIWQKSLAPRSDSH